MAHAGGEAVMPVGAGHLAHAPEEHHGGTARTYVEVAIFLAIITSLEVVVWYIKWLHHHGLLGPILLILSAVKFVTVVGVYMHLKYDDRRLTWVFAFGLTVATSIILTLYFLFKYHEIVIAIFKGMSRGIAGG